MEYCSNNLPIHSVLNICGLLSIKGFSLILAQRYEIFAWFKYYSDLCTQNWVLI